ncbi:NAD(P)H-binding protein [Salinibius halmophilus]|uniref:NAD(P)H-binding protein n=1 Tax=Salinibius halmophilus TaxID=1853216 RepID=UPI000E669F80|nr:NAD(P)H-binding protein [Salinibius halmophilus]
MKLLLFGATGAVGKAVLERALADDSITEVVAPTRRLLAIEHAKLVNPVIDFNKLAQLPWWQVDACICALGTTRKQAGSAEAFKAVDLGLVEAIAKRCKAEGVKHFVLNSSVGAHTGTGLYLSTKKAAEAAVLACDFPATTFVRPGLIDASGRPDFRFGEALALAVLRPFSHLLPTSYRPIEPLQIAQHMLASITRTEGHLTLENPHLHKAVK